LLGGNCRIQLFSKPCAVFSKVAGRLRAETGTLPPLKEFRQADELEVIVPRHV